MIRRSHKNRLYELLLLFRDLEVVDQNTAFKIWFRLRQIRCKCDERPSFLEFRYVDSLPKEVKRQLRYTYVK